MRSALTAIAISVTCLAFASSANATATISLLWAQGSTFGEPVMGHDLPRITDGSIDGGLLGEGLTGYSTLWIGSHAGEQAQLDLFVSFSNDYSGLAAVFVSVSFDNEGHNVLNVVDVHEYNLGKGTGCSGDNICNWAKLENGQLRTQTPGPGSIIESSPGSGGSVMEIEAGYIGQVLTTKAANQIATLRLGSIMFELNSPGLTTLTPYFDTTDGIVAKNGSLVSHDTVFLGAVAFFPEPEAAMLLGMALLALAAVHRR